MMRRILSCRPSPAMVVAFVALSVALAGTATALPGRNTVKSDDIRTNAVGKSEIKRGAVGASEAATNSIGQAELIEGAVTGRQVAESTLVDVRDLADGAVTANELADNSVTSAKLIDGTLAAADLGANSVTSDEIATNAVNSDEIATNAVGSDEIPTAAIGADEIAGDSVDGSKVRNGGLAAADNKGAAVVRPDFPSIAPDTCSVIEIGAGVNTVGETVAVTPRESFPGMLTISTSGSNLSTAFRLNVCNPTAAPVDPPETNFSFVVFDN